MREIKIFIVVAFIIGVIYYGVEPLAHHAMHPDAAPSDYAFKDLEKFGKFDFSKANKDNGKELFASNCTSCHAINVEKSEGFNDTNVKTAMLTEKGGIVPPDLSNAGLIFDANFLAHFIKDPVRATLLDNKFQVSCDGLSDEESSKCESANEGKESYPMMAFNGALSDEEIVDIVAYLQSVAPKHISDKEVFLEACNRCHAAVYDKGQYDSKFFASHNSEVKTLFDKVEKLSSEGKDFNTILASLDSDDMALVEYLLGMQKLKEKMSLSEEELDKQNADINAKTLESYGIPTLLEQSIVKDSFNRDGLHAITDSELVKGYLGNTPPDLSMMIRAKGASELATFINNPRRVALIDIQKAILSGLAKEAQQKEIDSLPSDLDQKDKEAKIDAIKSKTYEDYGIKLPENATKSEWQSNDDYTNMAYSMNVMPSGKAMPRVGLTKEAQDQVISYLSTIGDSKKEQRDALGKWIVGFFVLLSIMAYLWKSKIWRDLH